MGSKTKTVSDLQAMRMFENEDNLYSQELIRLYARIGSLEPTKLIPPLIQDSTTFFNEKVFEHFGATANIEMNIIDYSDDSILAYIKSIDSSATEVLGSGTVDSLGNSVKSEILKVKDSLSSEYSSVGGNSQVASQSLTFDTTGEYTETYPAYNIIGDIMTVVMVNNVPDTSFNPITEEATVRMRDIDTGAIKAVVVKDDKRTVYAVEYLSGMTHKYVYIYTEDMTGEAVSERAFMLMMKTNFNMVGDPESSERIFLYARFGLNAEDENGDTLESSLEDGNIKDSFLTYSIDRFDDEFGHLVEDYYQGGDVEVIGDISFIYKTSMGFNDTVDSRYEVEYDGVMYPCDVKDDNDEWMPYYIIPLSAIHKMPMHLKFEVYNKMFSMFVFSQTTVDVKWYQTVLFRFVMMVVAVVFSVLSLGTSVAYAMAMVVGGSIASYALGAIDPRIAMIIGLVIAIISFDTTKIFNSVLNLANKVLETVQTFNQVAFQSDMERLQKQQQQLADEQKEYEEENKEESREMLMINFSDKIEYGYNGLYDLAYNMPDVLANSVNPESYMPKYG